LTNGAKGTATITGPHTGAFTYTPNPARFGTDTVVFQASNGSNSPPATVTVEILPVGTIPGNLLVANLNPPFLVRINPTNGDTGPLASGGYLSAPAAVAYEALGTVLVADQSNGLIRVNPDNGNQTQLVTSNQLPYPLFIAVESTGNILVSDRYNGLQRFNSGGTLITSIPTSGFVLPGGLALANNGQIFASDAAFIAHQPASDKIVEIDPVTFAQTLLSSGGLLVSPTGLAVEPDGSFVSTQFENNEVVRVGFPGGTQTVLTTNSLLNSPFDIAVDGSDDIYLVNRGHDNGTGSVVQVNPESGIQTLIASGGLVGDPLGIAIAGITPPLIITNVVLEGGSVLLQGKGPASSQVDVLGTTNLVIPLPQWLDLGQATEISPGEYQFTDSLAKDYPARFYVLRIP
jgi:sugar lactone lactonase YvrE